jgi:hypothetical protein
MCAESNCMTALLTMTITRLILNQLLAAGKLAGQRNLSAEDRNGDNRLAYAGAKLTFVGNAERDPGRPLGERFSTEVDVPDENYTPVQSPDDNEMDELGCQCADIGLGIDLVNWSSSLGAIAALCPLADRSGAPAPSCGDMLQELTSRAPWKCVFGAELRLRVSPGFSAETTPLGGPGYSVNEQLWRAGCFSPMTAVTMDLRVLKNRHKANEETASTFVPGVGDVPLEPVIQTCFAYTTIQYNEDAKEHQIVRRMRIASRQVSFARTVEELFGSVDPEALAVVLFQKLAVSCIDDGPRASAKLAVEWLGAFLRSVYKSAEEEFERPEASSRYIVASDRLLDMEDGTLSSEEILLAAGHERLRPVALMVYLLLQTDPLRLSSGLSVDERYSSISQMIAMPPNILTRAIAPRLQLWSPTKILLEVLELRSDAVQSALLENTDGTVLLLDTPNEIVVMDARFIISDKAQGKVEIGHDLKLAVEDAAQSYRVRPSITFEVDQRATSGEFTLLRLLDCLIEDTSNTAMGYSTFSAFKTAMASEIEQ